MKTSTLLMPFFYAFMLFGSCALTWLTFQSLTDLYPHSCLKPVYERFGVKRAIDYYSKNNDLNKKFELYFHLLALFGAYLFVLTLLVMLIRIFTGKSDPVNKQDPKIIVVLNRIIQNSIEQGLCFFLVIIYPIF